MPAKTHGGTGTRLYRIWTNMKARCYRKTAKEFENYGGRGIAVCDEWRNDFVAFRDWSFENGYEDNLTIDRIDNSLGYSPKNCRWITNDEQQCNKRVNVNYTCFGKTQCLAEWSKETGIGYKTLQGRIQSGVPLEVALTKEVQKTNLVDLSGKRFSRLVVISLAHTKHGAHWICKCDCGNETIVRGYALTSGATKSCGCLQKENAKNMGKIGGKSASEKARQTIILQMDDNLSVLQSFHGFVEASENTGICKSCIVRSANSNFRLRAGGYYWSKEGVSH